MKNLLWQTIYNINYTQTMFKVMTKMIESTYKVNAHCNLLYTLKVWNDLNYIPKKRLFFFLKLLVIMVTYLTNVNRICGLLRNR